MNLMGGFTIYVDTVDKKEKWTQFISSTEQLVKGSVAQCRVQSQEDRRLQSVPSHRHHLTRAGHLTSLCLCQSSWKIG